MACGLALAPIVTGAKAADNSRLPCALIMGFGREATNGLRRPSWENMGVLCIQFDCIWGQL